MIGVLIKKNERVTAKFEELNSYRKIVTISRDSYYEIKRGLLATNVTGQLTDFEGIRQELQMLFWTNRQVLDKAAEMYVHLRQRGKLIQDADRLIAATTLTPNFIPVSDDLHFQRIRGLIVESWLIV